MVDNPYVISDVSDQKHDFFFYGMLLVPSILERVLGRDCKDLIFQDATLPDYTRHCVKGEDYPAVVNRDQTNELLSKVDILLGDDVNTRGTLVKGLCHSDTKALDIFEGSQYGRIRVPVRTLTRPSRLGDLTRALRFPNSRQPMISEDTTDTKVDAWVYVWDVDLDGLEPKIWSFEQFIRDKAHLWTSKDSADYKEVDQHHAENVAENDADEDLMEGKTMEGYPDFGHNMLKYWRFDPQYTNLNHGSYGSPPRAVVKAMRKISDQVESAPDIFMRRTWLPLLTKVRMQVADIINAQADEVVIVPSATHGVNNIANQLNWRKGDIIVLYSTSYNALAQTMKYICDRHDDVTIEHVDLTFPCPHSEVIAKTEAMLEKYNHATGPRHAFNGHPEGKSHDKRVRMVLVDTIASNPGVAYPWEEIVGLCKKYGAISMVDGAHSIGQHVVNVKNSDPDFLVSNCHKWLMSHRGGCVMYVAERNRQWIRSSFPTSAGYESTKYPTVGWERPWDWEVQYQWTGTQDWCPFFSISAAIKFRKEIGGEERIMKYNHTLAVQGGKRLSKRWGVPIMENKDLNDGELTVAMVNIALPEVPAPANMEEQMKQAKYLEDGLFAAKCFAAPYRHSGRWWIRCSAQVWNDLSDFDRVADVYDELCAGLRYEDFSSTFGRLY